MKHWIPLISLMILFGACSMDHTPSTPTAIPIATSALPATQTTSPQASPSNCETAPAPNTIEQACVSPATGLHYWLYLPKREARTPTRKLPLLVYLHGFSHSGSDLSLVLSGGLPAQLEHGRALPMIVASP